MDDDEYALLVGKIHSNLLSIELLLRLTLHHDEDGQDPREQEKIDIWDVSVGTQVPINALTDYRTLGQLIRSFNRLCAKDHPELRVDNRLVHLRDAFAHGRVMSSTPTGDNRLVKFSKPHEGSATVTVINSDDLSENWLRHQVRFTRDELIKITKAPGSPVVPPGTDAPLSSTG